MIKPLAFEPASLVDFRPAVDPPGVDSPAHVSVNVHKGLSSVHREHMAQEVQRGLGSATNI